MVGGGLLLVFKQADDREKLANPQILFPHDGTGFYASADYEAIKIQANQPPVLYSGWHKADHWVINYTGDWQTVADDNATFGSAVRGMEGASFELMVKGRTLEAVFGEATGLLQLQVDDQPPVEVVTTERAMVLDRWRSRPYRVRGTVLQAPVVLDGFIVE